MQMLKKYVFLGDFHSNSIIMGNLIMINSSCHWVQSSFDKYMAAQSSYDRSVSLELSRRK